MKVPSKHVMDRRFAEKLKARKEGRTPVLVSEPALAKDPVAAANARFPEKLKKHFAKPARAEKPMEKPAEKQVEPEKANEKQQVSGHVEKHDDRGGQKRK